MIIGLPKEVKQQENRVALTPAAVHQLTQRGHRVLVETGAGEGSVYPDAKYVRAGAEIVQTHEEVFGAAEIVIKVKEPQPSEIPLLRSDLILFTYLHLAADKKLTDALLETGCTGIAYETISVNRKLPLLEPMSEIAGRMSTVVGAYHLAKYAGGSGVLLSGVPGVLPGKVVILGGGTSGVQAARIALGMGANTTIMEINLDRIRYLDATMPGLRTLYSTEQTLADMLGDVDLLIGAVLVPGAKAPKLVTRDMLSTMKPGSVLVDIAVDQGGCAETTRPTTLADPVFVEENIVHYCVTNMPGAYARTATQALTNATSRYLGVIADNGLEKACEICPELVGGINCQSGRLTCEPVAQAHEMPYTPPRL